MSTSGNNSDLEKLKIIQNKFKKGIHDQFFLINCLKILKFLFSYFLYVVTFCYFSQLEILNLKKNSIGQKNVCMAHV
jgi:hypothetical protein